MNVIKHLRYFYLGLAAMFMLMACKKDDAGLNADYKRLGTAAHQLLAATTYSALTVQINYEAGQAPSDSSLDIFKQFLQRYLNKPDGITILKNQISSNQNMVTLPQVVSTEKMYRTKYTAGKEITVHVLIVNGHYSEPDILATSYWNTSFVIFGKTLNETAGGAGQASRTRLLATLFCHEMGHLLGLVNQGSPMLVNHQANGAHCNNVNCLMYFGIETTIISGLPAGNFIPSLDANCQDDLRANGGK